MTDKIVEIMHRAMTESKAWPAVFSPGSAAELSQAALSALEAAGYVVVPKEPSPAMVEAGCAQHKCVQADPWYGSDPLEDWDAENIYRAMLAAAQRGE